MTRPIALLILPLALLSLTACGTSSSPPASSSPPPADASAQPGKTGLANPASVHCETLGGKLEIRSGKDGQYGVCHLPDGRVCEEWALFRDGKCEKPAD